jgi:protein-S-isoprenylcysteine O-methyltransferase Ste14
MTSQELAEPALRTLKFTIRVPGKLVILVPLVILGVDFVLSEIPWHLRLVGLIPVVAGTIVYLWCAYLFAFKGHGTPGPGDPPTVFVAKGPYRLSRNPMWLGVLFVLGGEAIVLKSVALLIYAVLLGMRFNVGAITIEEPMLRERFGVSYEKYCQRVPRWIRPGKVLSPVANLLLGLILPPGWHKRPDAKRNLN